MSLDRLIELHNPQTYPGWLYYFGDDRFAVFYIEDIKGELKALTPQMMQDYY